MITAALVPGTVRRTDFAVALERLALSAIPALVFVVLLVAVIGSVDSAFDFRFAYWPAAQQLLHGGDPYAVSDARIRAGLAFVYPPLAAILFVPLAALPLDPACTVATLLCACLPPLALLILGVRDWRVYVITLIWQPLFASVLTANLSALLVLLTACAWRWRERPVVAGLTVAIAVSLKPFTWPLVLWLVATRRWAAGGWSLVWGLVLNLVAWGIVGFGRIGAYLHDSGLDTQHAWRQGYSLVAFAGRLGLGRSSADTLVLLASLAIVGLLVFAGIVRRSDRGAVTLAVTLMLVASPLVWAHYFALLLVPLALFRPRLHWLWALPVVMWAASPSHELHTWQAAIVWLAAGTVLVALAHEALTRSSAGAVAVS